MAEGRIVSLSEWNSFDGKIHRAAGVPLSEVVEPELPGRQDDPPSATAGSDTLQKKLDALSTVKRSFGELILDAALSDETVPQKMKAIEKLLVTMADATEGIKATTPTAEAFAARLTGREISEFVAKITH